LPLPPQPPHPAAAAAVQLHHHLLPPYKTGQVMTQQTLLHLQQQQ
jgi:hypothetical protein